MATRKLGSCFSRASSDLMAYQKMVSVGNGAPLRLASPLNSVSRARSLDYASQRFAAYQGYWEDKLRVVRRALTLPVIKKHTYTVKSWDARSAPIPRNSLHLESSHWTWDKPYTVRNPSNLDDGPWNFGWLRCRLHAPHEATSTCGNDLAESIPRASPSSVRAAS